MYGNVKKDNTIVFVNLFGVILMLCYIIVFYKFAFKSKDLRRQILSCVVLSIFFYGYLSHDENIYRQQAILGNNFILDSVYFARSNDNR